MSCAALARKTESAEATKRSSSLRVGEPNDAFEREADRMADRVMTGGRPWSIARMNAGPSVQRTCSCGGSGECQECKKKLQRKAASSAPAHATPNTDRVLQSPGRPLDRATRAFMEPRFGHDFSRVRVHHDGEAAQSAGELHAQAYTVGNHIAFAAGNFQPSTRAGRTLLAHELTHVVQQNGAADRVQRSPDDDDDTPEPTRPWSVDLLSLRPEDMCGPLGCYKGDQQYDEYKKKQEEREELDRRIRSSSIVERISFAANRLYAWQYKVGNHDGLWKPSGEEVWAYGYYQENDEPHRLFTEDEKDLVIQIRDGYLAAQLAKAGEELEREKERAEWARQDAMEAQYRQIISPAPFVEGVAFSAINPYLGAAVMGTQTGMMAGEAYNACRSGPSLDCADKVVPIIGAVAMEGLMGGEPFGNKREGTAPKPNTRPRPALGSKDPAFWKETAPTGKNPAARLEPGKSPVTDLLAAKKPGAKPVTDPPRPAGGAAARPKAAANENVAPPIPVANENVVPQQLQKTGTTGDSDIVASRNTGPNKPRPNKGRLEPDPVTARPKGSPRSAHDEGVLSERGMRKQPTAYPRAHQHHLFPKELKAWFEARFKGLEDIDDYTVYISAGEHEAIHLSGDGLTGWNQEWKNFMENNKNATPQEIFEEAGRLMDKYKISDAVIDRYQGNK